METMENYGGSLWEGMEGLVPHMYRVLCVFSPAVQRSVGEKLLGLADPCHVSGETRS